MPIVTAVNWKHHDGGSPATAPNHHKWSETVFSIGRTIPPNQNSDDIRRVKRFLESPATL
eukprot:scaffold3618_cov129-Cylindrotheca_fusiformis.AAC.17